MSVHLDIPGLDRIDITRSDPTPFGRLELIRHGLGADFKHAANMDEAFGFFDETECDVIKARKVKVKKEDGTEKEIEEIKMDRLAVMKEMRKQIRELTGLKLEELIKEANSSESGFDPEHMALKERVRNRIAEKLPFFRIFKPEAQDIGFEILSREANDLFDKLRSSRCYKNVQKIDMLNEIRNCDDPAKLLLFAFDDRVSNNKPKTLAYRKRKKFEALRKLLLMLDLAEAKSLPQSRVNHKNALEELTDFFYRYMVYPDQLTSQYLVADLDETGKVLNAFFADDLESIEPKLNRRVQEFLARTMREDMNGESVETIMDDRIKKAMDLVVKAYDANTDIGSRDVDRNGQSFTFKSRAEWEHFFSRFIPTLIADIYSNTQKRLAMEGSDEEDLKTEKDQLECLGKAKLVRVRGPKNKDGSPGDIYGMYLSTREVENGEIESPNPEAFFTNIAAKAGKPVESATYEEEKAYIDDTIVIYQIKDNLEGQGEFPASREVGSPDLAVLKGKLEVRGSDKKRETRHYEIQIYDPKGRAEAQFRLGVSHESYSIKRANKVGKVFWPEEIYRIDHGKAQKDSLAALKKELGYIHQENYTLQNDACLDQIFEENFVLGISSNSDFCSSDEELASAAE